jgi:probable DNA metabolism protein
MKTITILQRPGFDEWRNQARLCLAERRKPHDVLWQDSFAEADLFAQDDAPCAMTAVKTVPKDFIDRARYAACHAAPDRFTLLYRILWRLTHGQKHLLQLKTDADILKMNGYVKAVRRDAYKITAFLRFRETADGRFVAWYEPEHFSLDLSLPFFQTRFKNMQWSILTPYLAAHWDGETLNRQDNPDPTQRPQDDNIEKYWLTYYGAIFNPARPKKAAMLNQMPKKYWKNMPETVLVREMLHTSEARARQMIDAGKGTS